MKNRENSFVLFPLGDKRFALPADVVNEMACPESIQAFPHTTRLLTGVLLRRGRIVPVCDVARVLVGMAPRPHRFCLIANLEPAKSTAGGRATEEWVAVPVTGECALVTAELLPAAGRLPAYVTGLLALADEIVQVLDLPRLMSWECAV